MTKHSRDSDEECREQAPAGSMASAVEKDGELPSSTSSTNVVKVFSATKRRDREALGERVTAWLRGHPNVQITRASVTLSSDQSFHCLSIVLFGHGADTT